MKYFVGKETVDGYNNASRCKPNQDRVIAESIDDNEYVLLIVSDGHGSKKRAERGAEFAVNVTRNELISFISAIKNGGASFRDGLSSQVARLKSRILYEWNNCVESDLKKDSFPEEVAIDDAVEEYGATLLVACILGNMGVLYLQLGDGEICVTMPDGSIFEPIPQRAEQIGNLTHSLCEEEAISFFDYRFCRDLPAAVIITTDGVANAFTEKKDFQAIGQKALAQIGNEVNKASVEKFHSALKALLSRCTEKSGDDCSIAFAVDININQIASQEATENNKKEN